MLNFEHFWNLTPKMYTPGGGGRRKDPLNTPMQVTHDCNTDSVTPLRSDIRRIMYQPMAETIGSIVHRATSSFSSSTASYGASTRGPASCSCSSCWCWRDEEAELARRPPTVMARPLSGLTNTLDILPWRFSPLFSRPYGVVDLVRGSS